MIESEARANNKGVGVEKALQDMTWICLWMKNPFFFRPDLDANCKASLINVSRDQAETLAGRQASLSFSSHFPTATLIYMTTLFPSPFKQGERKPVFLRREVRDH